MKKYISMILVLILLLIITACGNDTKNTEPKPETKNTTVTEGDTMEIKIGKHTMTAVLEKNPSVEALKELLADGPLTISASNYGGFEKVCSLETELPRADSQITTHAGDICLYNGNQIVIFYSSNSWTYTKLGTIFDPEESELEEMLSGGEKEVTFSLKAH